MASYQELLERVRALEAGAASKGQSTISLEKVLAESQVPQAESYSQLVSLAEKVEAGSRQRPREERARPTPQPAQPVRAQPAPQVPYEAAESALKGKARDELASMTSTLSHIAPKLDEVTASMSLKDLVLPNLPIAEQISELEKIIEGTRSGIFDKAQLATLRKELRGLRVGVARDEVALRKSGKEPPESEKAMWTVREERLDEAMAAVK